MKITVQRPCAVLRLFAGLFFLFITFAATAGNPDDWENNAATSIANAGGGDGKSFENPILIASAEELAYFARQVNNGAKELKLDKGESIDKNSTSGKSGFFGYYFALSDDIDLKGKNWMPIGNSGSITFRAHFDGKGHKVKGVKVKIESDSQGESVFAGLFGYVINGTLQNLGVELAADGIKAASTGNYVYAGGIVGSNVDATLRNCYVEGKGAIKITGIGAGKGAYAGGIAGFASAAGTGSLTLTNCYATVEVEVEVEATASGLCEVGGIAGDVSGTLSYTYATGNVRAKGGTEQYAGGICGVYSGGGELSHNLALNKNVRGDGTGDNFHRIVGYLFNPGSSTLYSNYANPGVKVNSNAVFASTPDSQDGGNTSLEDFESVLKNAPSNDNAWSTAWVFPEDNLPQLRMATDDGKGAPSFADWPAGSQTDYLASKYLNAFIWSDYAATSIANAGGGDGKSFENPILIASAEELAYFARQVNNGAKELKLDKGESIDKNSTSGKSGFFGYYFALSDDIDLKGKNWMPIGNSGSITFRAHFDGKGHKVKGVKIEIERNVPVYAGLFGYVINGTLQNLGVELADGGIKVTSTGENVPVYAGGIVGQIQGYSGDATLRNCYVEGAGAIEITEAGSVNNASAGGIVGVASGINNSLTLTNCYATVDVEATASGLCEVGGIAGNVSGTLSYTYATGNVRATGGTKQYVGGICGRYNGGNDLSHNLALNKNVYGDGSGDNIHRIAGYLFNSTSLYSNYANPGVKVNFNAVFASTPDSQDGGNTSLEDFESVLKNAPSDDNAWVFPEGNLPQLRMATDEGKGAPSFEDWPAGSQTDYLASKYLNAFIWSDYAATSIANAGGGDGKSFENPILIASAEELAYFARQVNNGAKELKLDKGESIDKNSTSGKSGFFGYYFALSDDIDLKGKNWMPIGNSNGITFCAHFDGKGHKMKGVKVKIESDNTTTDVYAGLFGNVVNGTLQNLGVELADDGIEAASTGRYVYAGGIAGQIGGIDGAATLRNCYVEGNGTIKITGTGNGYGAFAGGIAGSADAAGNSSSSLTLTNCYATVNVEATASDNCHVGGIAGYALGTLSYTYATGDVRAQGGNEQRAGGICGYYNGGVLSHNLALNKSVRGDGRGDNIHRIVGILFNPNISTLLSNYAHPAMLLNGSLANSYDAGSPNGADTYRETVREDLAGIPPAAVGWEEAWDWTDGTRSPRLKLVEEATDGSLSYPGTLLAGQLPNDAFGTLAALPLLHLTQATGGTLSVTAGQPATPLDDGDAVRPGTPLTLSYSTGTDYFFEGFFSGTGRGSVDTPLGGSTVEMPRADLWLRASFRYEAPTPPEPVYYTVTLPSVEGVTTDPAAGSHQVESWDNFRFYLTLDEAYDQSVPVVTTDDGKTITPRTSDGAYVLKNVRSDLSVTISGIVKNPPVANEPVASTATRIFTRDGRLFITADRPMQAQVVALTGRLVRSLTLTAGTTRIDALSPGIYLVRLDNGTVEKVIVRR